MATKRTTHRSSAGKKLYAVRDKEGKFEDIKRSSKSREMMERTAKRFSGAMKRLAKS